METLGALNTKKMKKILFVAMLLLASCSKEELDCPRGTRVYLEDGLVKQSFEDGTIITLADEGDSYEAKQTLCD